MQIFLTSDSDVIMFSPCVFVCLFVCVWLSVYDCHDVCPHDLTMKDWCHTYNILQVHSWLSLVLQMMFHALMTSSMTSAGHKVDRSLKLIYLHQYFSYSVEQKLKISEMLITILLVYPTSGITSGYQTQLHFDLRYEKIVPNYDKKYFSWWWHHRWRHRGTWKLASLFMLRGGSMRERIARAMSRQYMRIS